MRSIHTSVLLYRPPDFGDEPGPSGTQHSPEPWGRLSAPPTSQATLVGTAPNQPERTKRSQVDNGSHRRSSTARGSAHRRQQESPTRPPQSPQRVAAPPAARSRNVARKVPASAAAAPSGAPYRNTRSKSRSVSVEPVPLDFAKRRRKGKGTKAVPLEPLQESGGEDVEMVEPPDALAGAPPVGQTLREEEDVEDILMAPPDQSGISESLPPGDDDAVDSKPVAVQGRQQGTARRQAARGRSLDTDDDQTDRALRRQAPPPAFPRPPRFAHSLCITIERELRL